MMNSNCPLSWVKPEDYKEKSSPIQFDVALIHEELKNIKPEYRKKIAKFCLETNSYTGDVRKNIDGITTEMAYAIEGVMVGKGFLVYEIKDRYNLPPLPERGVLLSMLFEFISSADVACYVRSKSITARLRDTLIREWERITNTVEQKEVK